MLRLTPPTITMHQPRLESDVPDLSLELPQNSPVVAVVASSVETRQDAPTAKNPGNSPAKKRTPIDIKKSAEA